MDKTVVKTKKDEALVSNELQCFEDSSLLGCYAVLTREQAPSVSEALCSPMPELFTGQNHVTSQTT